MLPVRLRIVIAESQVPVKVQTQKGRETLWLQMK